MFAVTGRGALEHVAGAVGERGEFESLVDGGIGRQDTRTAGIGDDGDRGAPSGAAGRPRQWRC